MHTISPLPSADRPRLASVLHPGRRRTGAGPPPASARPTPTRCYGTDPQGPPHSPTGDTSAGRPPAPVPDASLGRQAGGLAINGRWAARPPQTKLGAPADRTRPYAPRARNRPAPEPGPRHQPQLGAHAPDPVARPPAGRDLPAAPGAPAQLPPPERAGRPTAVPAQPTRAGEERCARPTERASHSGVAGGGCARRRQGQGGAEAGAERGARRACWCGLCPFPLGRCRWFDPPPRVRCLVPAPAGLYHRAVPPGFLPPTTTINFPPPPGSAVGWPRPGSETRKELGAILGGTKQRRNTLPVYGPIRKPGSSHWGQAPAAAGRGSWRRCCREAGPASWSQGPGVPGKRAGVRPPSHPSVQSRVASEAACLRSAGENRTLVQRNPGSTRPGYDCRGLALRTPKERLTAASHPDPPHLESAFTAPLLSPLPHWKEVIVISDIEKYYSTLICTMKKGDDRSEEVKLHTKEVVLELNPMQGGKAMLHKKRINTNEKTNENSPTEVMPHLTPSCAPPRCLGDPWARARARMTDYGEEQRNELEALESIYPDSFTA
ncbi:hypothetical protein P7K49_021121 [Saguinus oedipus]|nr:hypothetical protein P7K49_021121 [Saguinus oedipus]